MQFRAPSSSCGWAEPRLRNTYNGPIPARGGPAHWASLEPDYAKCAAGKEQSPIDIKTRNVRHETLPQLSFDYHASALHVINNGHTIEVDVPAGSTLNVGGHRYRLVQFHFHHPSEETIDGRSSDMVAHFVHRDAEGHLAVVAVLLKSGAANPLLSAVWRYLPREEGGEARPSGVVIGPGELIPAARSYYMFPGSLTTPPCSEGVRWFVLKSSMTLSPEQLETFRELYPANARGTQPLNGRVVLSSG